MKYTGKNPVPLINLFNVFILMLGSVGGVLESLKQKKADENLQSISLFNLVRTSSQYKIFSTANLVKITPSNFHILY